jgi:hypothetical protein
MVREKWLLILTAFVTVAGSSAYGQQKSATTADLTKFTVIEKPAEKVLARNTAGLATADITKTVRIEKPASTILAHNTAGVTATGKEFVNPRVQPGRVRWHPSLESACEAAKKSGKPVLLFQMMGKLDDQFC